MQFGAGLLVFFSVIVLAAGVHAAEEHFTAPPAEKVRWGYEGEEAPAHWGDLHEAFGACRDGKNQSPVNIARFAKDGSLPELEVFYKAVPLEVVNNSHTILVNYAPGNGVTLGDHSYDLSHFQFHTPSEHYLDGAPYPLEIQFVHKDDNDLTAIISVMAELGAPNRAFETILQNAPRQPGLNEVEKVSVNAGDLMPGYRGYYYYPGSLTTPPCTEGVAWFVLQDPIQISEAQLRAFQMLFPFNARPLQPLRMRVVNGQ